MLPGLLTWVQHHSLQGPKLLSKKYEVSQGNKIHTHILTSALPFPSSFSKMRLLYLRSDFNKTNAAFLTVSLKAKKEPEKHFSGQNYSLLLVSIHFLTFTFHFLAFWNLYSFFLLIRTLVRDFTRAVLPQRGGLPGPHAVQARLLSVSQKRKWGLRATRGLAQRGLSGEGAPGRPPGRYGAGMAPPGTAHCPLCLCPGTPSQLA